MAIYLYSLQPEGYKELTLLEGETYAEHNCLRWAGMSKIDSWKPFELIWLEDELSGENDQDADFIKCSGISVISENAYQVLYEPLKPFVEFLPVYVNQKQRYILNIINVLDIMDKSRSLYKIYSDGKIGLCEHAFINEPPAENLVYLVEGFMGRKFVNDDFVQLIESNGLTGTLIREYKNPK